MREHQITNLLSRQVPVLVATVSLLLTGTFLFSDNALRAQDLEDLLNQKLEEQERTEYVSGTFKATRLINGHTVEIAEKKDLLFLVSHRFGTINSGFYNFFGLDDASTRISLEYGPFDHFALGIGRSTWEKTWDGFLKYRILRQSTGERNMPVTLTLLTSASLYTLKPVEEDRSYTLSNRLAYCLQLHVARKISPELSLQLSPSWIHKNLVPRRTDQNDVLAIGAGGRYNLTSRFSVNMEYYHLLPGQSAEDRHNSLSVGFDIQTGGHVFQLMLSNSRTVFEKGFITETSGNWLDGDIHFGFNITRVFHLGKQP